MSKAIWGSFVTLVLFSVPSVSTARWLAKRKGWTVKKAQLVLMLPVTVIFCLILGVALVHVERAKYLRDVDVLAARCAVAAAQAELTVAQLFLHRRDRLEEAPPGSVVVGMRRSDRTEVLLDLLRAHHTGDDRSDVGIGGDAPQCARDDRVEAVGLR